MLYDDRNRTRSPMHKSERETARSGSKGDEGGDCAPLLRCKITLRDPLLSVTRTSARLERGAGGAPPPRVGVAGTASSALDVIPPVLQICLDLFSPVESSHGRRALKSVIAPRRERGGGCVRAWEAPPDEHLTYTRSKKLPGQTGTHLLRRISPMARALGHQAPRPGTRRQARDPNALAPDSVGP